MILFPAVDIKGGQCVRLRQGVAEDVTIFSKDPVAMAAHWETQGAEWLHVIDLDGAFDGEPVNRELIGKICSRVGVPVQLGGGVRDIATAKAYLDAGVARLIIGTMALEEPETYAELVKALPEGTVGVSLDAKDGRLKTKGWVADAGLTARDVLPRLEAAGTAFIIYTDIGRDGMQSGVNIEALKDVLAHTSLPVLAAGGVTVLEDLAALTPLAAEGLAGVITGRAIYEGTLDLRQALDWLEQTVN